MRMNLTYKNNGYGYGDNLYCSETETIRKKEPFFIFNEESGLKMLVTTEYSQGGGGQGEGRFTIENFAFVSVDGDKPEVIKIPDGTKLYVEI